LTVYDDHDDRYRETLPKLKERGVKKAAAVLGMSERRARNVLARKALPHPSHRKSAQLRLEELTKQGRARLNAQPTASRGLVRAGVKFENGVMVGRADEQDTEVAA
jgi:NAD(P)H-dependent flavin oxidoreductase YrpB (nitropropane dioxygenase family)